MSIPEKKLAACVEVPGPPSEPLASVIRQPLSGSAPASARATCAEPPRGKKKSAESTRPRGRARSVGERSRLAAAAGLPRPTCSTGAILLEREDGCFCARFVLRGRPSVGVRGCRVLAEERRATRLLAGCLGVRRGAPSERTLHADAWVTAVRAGCEARPREYSRRLGPCAPGRALPPTLLGRPPPRC